MTHRTSPCPACERTEHSVSRRGFFKTAGIGVAAMTAGGWIRPALAQDDIKPDTPESVVKLLYQSLSAQQKKAICFDWDYVDPDRGLLRTRVAANWRITEPPIKSDFFTADQQQMIRGIFEGIIHPAWHAKFDKQMTDDDDGFGTQQRIALFGNPTEGKFEFVLTGRHVTLRCDGNSADHVAFAGPIFYGHAASGLTEKPDHPGNVFWHQALAANAVFEMLDEKQRKQALVRRAPRESAVGFRGKAGDFDGIPVAELQDDQKENVQQVLQKLIEPFRQNDRDEVVGCLKAQGGLDQCHLAFYRQGDLGQDGVWDIWRLEGPAFVWHFRGSPHVHVWVNVADDPSVPLNA
jgi:hypothetical protein